VTGSTTPMLGDAPAGMPDPSVAPPQIARAGDPFADIPENLPGLLYARKTLRRAEPGGRPLALSDPRRRKDGRIGIIRCLPDGARSIPS